MDLHSLGSLIWALVVVIAVISSVVRSAKRTIERSSSTPPAAPLVPAPLVRAPVPAAAPSAPSMGHGMGHARTGGAVVSNAAFTRGIEAPASALEAAPGLPPLPEPTPSPLRVGVLFGSRRPLMQGIIALEVLGPPRALHGWMPIV